MLAAISFKSWAVSVIEGPIAGLLSFATEPNLDPPMLEPVHIAFYASQDAPIGQFKALLYLPRRGDWEN